MAALVFSALLLFNPTQHNVGQRTRPVTILIKVINSLQHE